MIKDEDNHQVSFSINPWTLFFNNPAIEKKYRNEYFQKSIAPFRKSFVVAIVIFVLFGFLDLHTSKNFLTEFYTIRYLVVTPAILLVFLISFHSSFKTVWQFLTAICYIIAGCGLTFMIALNPVNTFYYGGLILVFMAGYFFVKLHLVWALGAGLFILTFFNLAPFLIHGGNFSYTEYFYIGNAFFVSANLIACVAIYNSQTIARKEFHRRLELKAHQEEIISINESLEGKVKERTHQINIRNTVLKEEVENRKKIEERLRIAVKKAEESDRLKSAFLANMSHEIRTPMNGIIGFLEMINNSEVSKIEQDQYLEIIQHSGNRLLQTINDIVEISKIESGELTLNYSEINLADTFKDVSDFFSFVKDDKNIKLIAQSFPEEFVIRTDGNKLESILVNLVKNAFKFTDSGVIEFGVTPIHPKLQFYVKDTGRGIPKERHEAIFNRFVQADMELSRGYEGVGLGLAISKAYVEYLGGDIWLESEPEKGSTFFFTILFEPVFIAQSNSDKISFKDTSVIPAKDLTVLVAEDDDVSYNLIRTILKNQNLKIIRARNGKEAIDIYKKRKDQVSFILMDIKMPVLDGIEATKAIRTFDKDIPIIAQTAFALSGDKDLALQAGCNHYLAKPLKRQDLLSGIKRFL